MNKYSSKSILTQASPSIKRHGPVTPMVKDTGITCNLGVPRIILRDVIKQNNVQSDDHQFFYKDSDNFKLLKPCSDKLEDIFKCSISTDQFTIAKCNSKNCKTCKILITDTSNLTNNTYSSRSFDNLTCKSSNVVYGLECSLCGLLFVGETKGQLNKRMNGYRSEINHAGNQML